MATVDSKNNDMVKKIGIVVAILVSYSFIYDFLIIRRSLQKICDDKDAGKAIVDAFGSLRLILLKYLIYIVLVIALTIHFKLNILIGILILASSPLYNVLSKLVLYNKPLC